ncbi:hypothetical protein CHS0354_022958 [Potamilus streckersoni]|uniref:Phytanoyl-CoA hydroxylase-interacting protein-like C-terminal domain-containing protein n=1 Tax=Potamilus streckersoni TaxID=2493646 RepID=A0AAE0S519_9BIVA|nr:hypothetical protein CHS0354_022958 [Potamilus streckersoni]
MATTMQVKFTNGPKLDIVWDPEEMNPAKIYIFMCNRSCPRKSFHWILDINHHEPLVLTFPAYDSFCGYDVVVRGLKPILPEAADLPHYEICASVSLGTGDTLRQTETRIQLMKKCMERYCAFDQEGDFEVKREHIPPSYYALDDLPASKLMHLIRVHQELPAAEFLYVHESSKGSRFQFPNRFTPASDYHVTVYESEAHDDGGIMCYSTMKISNVLRFRAYMTKNEVNELYQKSRDFMLKQKDAGLAEISHFYRDKLPAYFDFIFDTNFGIVPIYHKTLSGDKASTIHLNLMGIFFHTLVNANTRQPPKTSCHGTKRLHIPATFFFDCVNIYFADFYCHYKSHKITLIFAIDGTKADKFCKARLIKLDPFKNPFLCRNPDGKVFVTLAVRVEVFYTAPILVVGLMKKYGTEKVFFTSVRSVFKPRDIVISKPKKEDCMICNLKARNKLK